MPLQNRLSAHGTIREFRAAAGLRYQEARRLAFADDRLAAVYLSGYAVEMLLKAAYFRLTGWGLDQPFTTRDMWIAVSYAKNNLGLNWTEQLHNLTGWAQLLIEDRRQRQVAYAPAFARSLNARVQRIYVNWRENLRYHANRPYRGEVSATLAGTFWLLGQYRFL